MTAAPRISLIVSTYNRPAALSLVLGGCLDQETAPVEIIVADDGSQPATREVVEQARAASNVPVVHVWHPDTGFRLAEIRNKAIAEASGDYLIFIDGDCVPQRDFVRRHGDLAMPGAMMTGSRILLGPALTADVEARQVPLQRQGVGFWLAARLRGQVNKVLPLAAHWNWLPGRDVEAFKWRRIKGCNLAAWKRDIEHIDGFDSTFTGWGHEDADFVARLHNAGIPRRMGFFATEVLHLWHKEAVRATENVNKQRVLERLTSKQRTADIGLTAARRDTTTVVTR